MKYIVLFFFGLYSVFSVAQIGVGTTSPVSSSALHVESTSQGVLIPRMNQAQRNAIASPATGLLIYQTDVSQGFYYFDGAVWRTFGAGSGWMYSGNTGTNDATNILGTTDNQDFVVGTNNSEIIRVSANGNVGFNTTTPSTKLHVISPVYNPAVLFDDSFEDSTIAPFSTGGDANWVITTAAGEYNAASGSLVAAKSGNISDNQITWIEGTMTIPAGGATIEFAYKTSTENNYDKLFFKIDGVTQSGASWDGSTPWTTVSYPVTAGTHTFRWEYDKDTSASSGADEVYIDDVKVLGPVPSTPPVLQIVDGTEGAGKMLVTDANGVANWQVVTPAGGGDTDWLFASGSTFADPVYHVGPVMVGLNMVTSHTLHVWEEDAIYTDSGTNAESDINIGYFEIQDQAPLSPNMGNFTFDGGVDNILPVTSDAYSLGSSTRMWKDVFTGGGVLTSSDRNLKEDIKPITYGLEELLQLKTISYVWKNDKISDFSIPEDEKELKIGFVAQELLQIIPEVVVTHQWKEYEENPGVLVKEENDLLGVRYNDLIPVAIKAVQEQQKKIEDIEELNAEIKEQIKTLKKLN